MKTAVTTSRPARNDEDFWRVRDLLIRTFAMAPVGHNWDVRRWDGKYFYNSTGRWLEGWGQYVRLWETADGEVVGCVCREGVGDAWFQIDPAYRFLEPEMIEWAESCLAAPADDAHGNVLELLVFEYDVFRQRLLASRGFQKMPYGGTFQHISLAARPAPSSAVPSPYWLRQVDASNDADCWSIARLLNAAFRRNFHTGPEFQNFARLAPCYVGELDLVAVAPDGTFAAYAGMPYDQANRRAIFEPVCTHPDHRGNGLASALMREALHRVQAMGALRATVDTGDMIPANALYDSLGFTEAYRVFAWRKILAP